MIVALYIMLTLIAICVALFSVVVFAPFSLYVAISANRYRVVARFLGYRFIYEDGKKRSRFLFFGIKNKAKKSPKEKSQKKDEKPKGKESEKQKKTRSAGIAFWLERRDTIKKCMIVIFRFVYEIIASFKFRLERSRIFIGDGDPALTGAMYGWISALKSSWSVLDRLEVSFTFDPTQEWDFDLQFVVKNNIFKLLVAPTAKAIWRLPKIKLIKLFRDYRKV